MEKELKYIAPEADILVAQVEKGFAVSGGPGVEDGDTDGWFN